MRPTTPALIAALAVCACQAKTDEGAAATEPASAPEQTSTVAAAPVQLLPAAPPAEFSGDIDVRGTEPFWSVKIRKDALTLERPQPPAHSVPNAGPLMEDDAAVWRGDQLKVALRKAPCSDGMSDKAYPMSAEVIAAGETLKGCAEPAAHTAPAATK